MRTVGGIEFDVERIISDFNNRVSCAEAWELPLKKVPKETRETLQRCSRRFMLPEVYKSLEHIMSLRINFDNNDFIYGLVYPTKYSCGDSEISLFLLEYNEDSKNTGRAELRYNYSNPNTYFVNKPFLGYIATEEEFQRQGLGTRRYRIMNALSLSLYNQVLNSDTIMTEPAKNLWKRLVRLGEAKHYLEGEKDRYHFI